MGAAVPVELKLLLVAVVIGFVQIVWTAAASSGGERNLAWLAGPRDDQKPVGVVAARLDRALRNFLETFPLFAAALIGCIFAQKLGPQTLYGSGLYVIARALYVPLYASGVAVVRTLVWTVSAVGIVMVIVAFFR
ncbi:MAPEG family protein [Phenylobacterium sp.]|uniref:MAPEG family protein n=1 Tax=Phenylobacterium sp. TaxID=1871053 RepID=UPI002F42A3A3